MKIIRLQSENFKRLQAVDISPDGDVIEVRGNNTEGKTSVLDSIYAALGGAAAAPIKPVRTGEEYAIIHLDLGDLKVTRYFDADGTDRLKVENAEGATFSEPQTMLNKLVGRIAFDPLAFARMPAKEQAAELRRLVPIGIDLEKFADRDKADTLARRDVNRDGKALLPRIAAISLPDDLPAKPDREAIVAALGSAGETNAAIERERGRRNAAKVTVATGEAEAERLSNRAGALRREADELDERASELRKSADATFNEIAALPPLDAPVDTAKLSTDLEEADKALRIHRAAEDRKILEAELATLRGRSEAFTSAIAQRAEARAKALAEAEMPVPGLSLATLDDGMIVTFEGEPFSQASGAQQLRVSMALAMAANPKLRVMLIKDGSLLDKNGWALIREMAAENDTQCWVEAVGEGDGVGIIMEAGKVRGAPEPEKMDAPKRRRPKVAGDPQPEKTPETDVKPSETAASDAVIPKPETPPSQPKEPPARRRPAAMREFNTKPLDDLFGGDKK